MKIIQIVPNFAAGDAIGNEVRVMKSLLVEAGYETAIYAVVVDSRLANEASEFKSIPNLDINDIIIYHFGVGCREILEYLKQCKCRKIMVYHNITPKEFFANFSYPHYKACEDGRNELVEMKDVFDYCLAVSEYNKQELINYRYSCPIDVLPLIINYEDYNGRIDSNIINKYGLDGIKNILFIGRIAPNKKQEDIISAFAYYKNHINNNSRLFLVGNHTGLEPYYVKLQDKIRDSHVQDVYITGSVSFAEVLAYYNVADIFLCLSEHEGFCVPLLEAMYFDIPIVAYAASAIPETMGKSGIILNEKNEKLIACVIDELMNNKLFKNEIIAQQRCRLQDFSYEKTSNLFLGFIKQFTEKNN